MIKLLTAEDLPLSAAFWDALMELVLPQHSLPPWPDPYAPDPMNVWLERLDLSEQQFLVIGAWRNLADVPSTIPHWPLRAVVGLAVEERAALSGVSLPPDTRTRVFPPIRARRAR